MCQCETANSQLKQDYAVAEEKYKKLFEEKVIVGFQNVISPTHFGEICRALGRVEYRYFNDGDHCFEGYGCETCGGEATFLKNHVSDGVKKHFTDFEAKKELTNSDLYEDWLMQLTIMLVNHMETSEDKPATVDCTAVESEWDQEECKKCNCYFPKYEVTADGHCEDCQEEIDEYEESLENSDEED